MKQHTLYVESNNMNTTIDWKAWIRKGNQNLLSEILINTVEEVKWWDNTMKEVKWADNNMKEVKWADNTVKEVKWADNTVKKSKVADNTVK